eukprot:PhM_4_TR16581/c0_g1_i1/m.53281/K15779/PGM2; phosphoglucomutase / phosphopentomutase
MSNNDLSSAIESWLAWDKNDTTRDYIQSLATKAAQGGGGTEAEEELRRRLLSRMQFGTAGLRAEMGPGNAYMNELTIIQTTQGLLRYLQANYAEEELKARGVVISYDARHNSDIFATRVASVFCHAGVRTYKFGQITPTPFVPFTVMMRNAVCGIMVTASHNPKQDNGYKVYWDNGAQIIPPHDSGIAAAIEANLAPWESSWTAYTSGERLVDPYQDTYRAYYERAVMLQRNREICETTPLRVAYTAMHGVGAAFTAQSLAAFGLPAYVSVVAQNTPDPEFPTVAFPNPEEGKSALNLSMETADENGCSIILANDPDADRLAVAERLPGGGWKVFTGNELGALFGWWLWASAEKKEGAKFCMVHSTVSSAVLQAMGRAEGFRVEETLTGFKWMANRAVELERDGYTCLFAFEEAIGFMCGMGVRDKDGVSAAAVMYEMAAVLHNKCGRSLTQQLAVIYAKYGPHLTNNSYYICRDAAAGAAMFNEIRNYNNTDTYPNTLAGYKVVAVRDLTTGFDSTTEDKKPTLPVSSSSQMVTFRLEKDDRRISLTIRGSGTEPKIKYYSELTIATPTVVSAELTAQYDATIGEIVKALYQPEKFGFEARKL